MTVRYRIKQDQYLNDENGDEVGAIAYAARRLREIDPPELTDLLAPDVLLVPTPGSAPLPPRQRNFLWVPRRICQELRGVGFGSGIEQLLVRETAVEKSATAGQENRKRPSPEEHYDSFAVAPRMGGPPERITLVDDFITKGATLLAGAARLAEAFPDAEIRAFALVRTQRPAGDPGGKHLFRAIVDPVYNQVAHSRFGAWRQDP